MNNGAQKVRNLSLKLLIGKVTIPAWKRLQKNMVYQNWRIRLKNDAEWGPILQQIFLFVLLGGSLIMMMRKMGGGPGGAGGPGGIFNIGKSRGYPV